MNNWYKNYLDDRMEKEASFKQGLMLSIISLLSTSMAWFEASQIRSFLDKNNVPYETFADTINDINDTSKDFEEINQVDVINAQEKLQDEGFYQNLEENDYPESTGQETRESLSPFETIARTIYDEARGEGYEGMRLVADVILNRSDGTPESMKKVSLEPWQFSGWNKGKMLPQGTGRAWEMSKALTKEILNPNSEPQIGNYQNFVNPQMVLKNNNIDIPDIRQHNDVLNIPEEYLKYLPTFMFKPVKVNLDGGAWKHVYPKRSNNLRTDFDILGKHVLYE